MTKKLYRSYDDRILGGVAGGLGEYLELDPTLIRLIFALAFMSGFGFIAYLFAWIIIPLDPSCDTQKTGVDEIKETAEKFAKDTERHSDNFRFWSGLIIVLFALSILAQNLLGFGLWHNFWPIILVALGIVLIAGSIDKKRR